MIFNWPFGFVDKLDGRETNGVRTGLASKGRTLHQDNLERNLTYKHN